MSTDEQPPASRSIDPLELARAWADRVARIAMHYERRSEQDAGLAAAIEAQATRAGKQQFEAAQMAALMAQVSVAEDIRLIRMMLVYANADEARQDGATVEPEP
jgi:hypothetical protein